MIVADASWVIALRDPADAHHIAASAINEATTAENVVLHPVTLAECLVAPARLGVLDDAVRALRAAYDICDMDEDAPVRWARLRADSGLRLPDVIVLDTAVVNAATAIATFDVRLVAVAASRGIALAGTG